MIYLSGQRRMSSYEEKMYEPLDRLVRVQVKKLRRCTGMINIVDDLLNQGRYEEAKRISNSNREIINK